VRRWRRRDFAHRAEALAQRLLGAVLVREIDGERLSGRIVEVEAYLGALDKAAHSYGGRRTARVEAMYAKPGTSYVYFTYGMHHCMNVVAGEEGEAVAVLLRALEPVDGLDVMRGNRTSRRGPGTLRDRDLCSGPGKLCQAFAIDRGLNGVDLTTSGELWIESGSGRIASGTVGNGPRIGIGSAGEWVDAPLRWWVEGNAHVSR
jgi:DNA-3-methyladenine glycosylase